MDGVVEGFSVVGLVCACGYLLVRFKVLGDAEKKMLSTVAFTRRAAQSHVSVPNFATDASQTK